MELAWLLLLCGTFALCTVTAPQKTSLRCRIGSFACKDGLDCFPNSHVCDGEPDCRDGSDEDSCPVDCSAGQFQCLHGKKCIDKSLVCDGDAQCQDQSDERDCLKPEGCVHECDDKTRCLPATFICDGEPDCFDGTDELSCVEGEVSVEQGGKELPPVKASQKCRIGWFGCADGSECILNNYVCDGDEDCPDGSDEAECDGTCSADQFQCAHGKKCIDLSQKCDGVSQCQDQSDERDCSKVDGCVHQCDSNSRCLPETFLCDGEKDCLDGSDEDQCAAEICSNSEFRCTSGQCVSMSMQCDGHPDCRDRSDEENCSEPPRCETEVRCPQSHECLLEDWLCDGEKDCRDGSDEQNCNAVEVACGEFQWTCASKTECIPTTWQCDGTKDCSDASDEGGCGGAECPAHQFLCGSSECIATALVCNGASDCQDGSDEGGDCTSDQCSADKSKCSQVCFQSPQGMKCACQKGFRLEADGVSCVDINECNTKHLNVCSHSCANTEGSFTCSCYEGYVLESDGHSCKIIGEPYLLAAVQSELFLMGLRGSSLDVLVSSEKKFILSVDYDWHEQKVFWINLNADSIKWSSLDQKNAGTVIKGINADCIAMDWIGRNLYWIDGFGGQINAIGLGQSLKGNGYIPILDEDMEQPHSLALMPEKGLMFWSETGDRARIERAGMDGSDRQVIIQDGLRWPASVTVDALGERVYWTDEKLRCIGTATLDGGDMKIFQLMETPSPFSVAVFNDYMIWSDTKRGTIQRANKITGKGREVLLKRPAQPLGLRVVHAALQARSTNVCAKHRCSHMCVLAPGPKAVCKCPSHLLLDEDKMTCSKPKDTSFVFVLSPSALTQMYLQNRDKANNLKAWPEHNHLPLPNVNEPTAFDFTVKDLTLYLADAGKGSAELLKVKESSLVPKGKLLHLRDDYVTALAVDWITLNLYWSSSRQPRLQVTSIQGTHTAVLISDSFSQGLDAIALHAPSGHICFVSLEKVGNDELSYQLECAFMNGRNRTLIKKSSTELGSLALSQDGSKVYWAELDDGLIVTAGVDGSGYKELKKAEDLTAFAFINGLLLWVTRSDATKFWFNGPNESDKLWFEVNTEVIGLKAYSKASQLGSNQCSNGNGGCQQLCLPFPGGRTCRCAQDFVSEDSKCKPDQRCPAGSKSCLDGQTCIPQELFCDGHPHCPDHSDENCPTEAGAKPPTSSPPKASASQSPHSTDNNVVVRKVEGALCNDKTCNGNGKCHAETGVCTCNPGYLGEFCENEAGGPNVMTLAGAAGGVVLLVVIISIVVAKKQGASSQRANAELGETGMSMLEKPDTNTSSAANSKEQNQEDMASAD